MGERKKGQLFGQRWIDACVGTVVRCLTVRDAQRGLRQKLYGDRPTNVLEVPVERLIGDMKSFLQHYT